jgi:DNA-binding transcriptional LysR family regulator
MLAHPDLTIDMHVNDYGVDPVGGGFEVAVQFGRPPETFYISRYLGTTQLVLVASPAYLARMGVPQTIADLGKHECIGLRGPTASTPFAWHLTRLVENLPGPATTIYHPQGRCFISSQLDTAIYAALNGLGISPIDIRAAQRYLDTGQLKIVLPDFELNRGGELYLLYPHRDHLPMRCRVFIDFVISVAALELKRCEINAAHAAA